MNRTRPEGLIGILQAAAASGRHPETLRKAALKGELPHIRERHTRKLLFRRDDLRRWIASTYEQFPATARNEAGK